MPSVMVKRMETFYTVTCILIDINKAVILCSFNMKIICLEVKRIGDSLHHNSLGIILHQSLFLLHKLCHAHCKEMQSVY